MHSRLSLILTLVLAFYAMNGIAALYLQKGNQYFLVEAIVPNLEDIDGVYLQIRSAVQNEGRSCSSSGQPSQLAQLIFNKLPTVSEKKLRQKFVRAVNEIRFRCHSLYILVQEKSRNGDENLIFEFEKWNRFVGNTPSQPIYFMRRFEKLIDNGAHYANTDEKDNNDESLSTFTHLEHSHGEDGKRSMK